MLKANEIYSMLGNETLWDTACRCHQLLSECDLPHAIVGGVAVCLHGYQRNTVDLDLLIRSDDSLTVKSMLEDAGFEWNSSEHEFRTENGIAVQFLLAGDKAGKGTEVLLPEPIGESHVETIDELPVVRLSKLIEMKIACGTGNIRRTHKDFADVVELIAIRNLDSGFARYLHKSVRKTYRELVKNARADS